VGYVVKIVQKTVDHKTATMTLDLSGHVSAGRAGILRPESSALGKDLSL
jgi:hypothetical protein